MWVGRGVAQEVLGTQVPVRKDPGQHLACTQEAFFHPKGAQWHWCVTAVGLGTRTGLTQDRGSQNSQKSAAPPTEEGHPSPVEHALLSAAGPSPPPPLHRHPRLPRAQFAEIRTFHCLVKQGPWHWHGRGCWSVGSPAGRPRRVLGQLTRPHQCEASLEQRSP